MIDCVSCVVIGSENWAISMSKISVFKLSGFRRVLFLDADTVAVSDKFRSMLELPAEESILAAVPDQSDGCWRRDVLNGGVLSFVPSECLFNRLVEMLRFNSCLSTIWTWSDQELINCACGTAGASRAQLPSLKCKVLPESFGSFTDALYCDKHNSAEIAVLHFATWLSKPWLTEAQLKDKDEKRVENSYSRFWHCLSDSGSLNLDLETLNKCKIETETPTSAQVTQRKIVVGRPPVVP